MSLTLNNVTTENTYPQTVNTGAGGTQAILRGGPAAIAEVDVYNAAVFLQLLTSDTGDVGQAVLKPELFVAPSHRTIVRKGIFGIQFRSAKEGVAAQITVELIAEDETWLGFLIAGAGAYQ